MGINIRYYVITIAAIFVAIGLGIFIGFNLNSQGLYLEQQRLLVEALEKKFSELTVERELLLKEIEEVKEANNEFLTFLEARYMGMIYDRLAGLNIALIQTTDQFYYQDLRQVLLSAGANVPLWVELNHQIKNPQGITLTLQEGQEMTLSSLGELAPLLNDALETLMVQGKETDVLIQLKDKGLLRYEYVPNFLVNAPLHYIVMAGGGIEAEEEKILAIDLDLVQRSIDNVIPVIAVERGDVSASYLPYYARKNIPVVQNVEKLQGKIALVLAIYQQVVGEDFPTISIIVPAFNEESHIESTIVPLLTYPWIQKIFVVDDGSTDETLLKIPRSPKVTILRHQKNSGKGKALATGVRAALPNHEIIAFLDGDVGDTSGEVVKLIYPLVDQEAEATIGKFPPAKKKGGFGLVKGLVKFGQRLHTGKSISSALSGQRCFTREVLRRLPLPDSGYGIELAMTIEMLRQGVKLQEVPVEMSHHETGRDLAGFLHRGKQFLQIAKVIAKI